MDHRSKQIMFLHELNPMETYKIYRRVGNESVGMHNKLESMTPPPNTPTHLSPINQSMTISFITMYKMCLYCIIFEGQKRCDDKIYLHKWRDRVVLVNWPIETLFWDFVRHCKRNTWYCSFCKFFLLLCEWRKIFLRNNPGTFFKKETYLLKSRNCVLERVYFTLRNCFRKTQGQQIHNLSNIFKFMFVSCQKIMNSWL